MSEKLLLQKAIAALQEKSAKIERLEKERTEPVAVIGIGCRFPGGAVDPSSYWNILQQRKDAIVKIPADRWRNMRYEDMGISPDDIIPYAGLLDDVYHFDPHFFHISAREAIAMDPQQRLLLEVGWEALEDAGQAHKLRQKDTGVFIGITQAEYGSVLAQAGGIDSFFGTGNSLNAAAGRIAYVMGFNGPAMAVDTACSSSLVSVHLACQSLRNGECRQALAGGVNLLLTAVGSVAAGRAQMLSKNGKCRSFDDAADGYVRGEGCGVVVLKRLSDAIRDKDNIRAVIRGTGVGQDGAGSGLTVPNGMAQQQLIRQVISRAGIAPNEIDYIEAHGTGTSLGDPIELRALGELFKADRSPGEALMVGAVKSNIGHLESAAGIAGLIKLILSLQHKSLTATLHFNVPNRHFSWEQYPIAVVKDNIPWKQRGKTRMGGVSSFGFSGTIAHVIVEEAPVATEEEELLRRPQHICCVTARSADALQQLLGRLNDCLTAVAGVRLEDVCHTINTGRTHFDHRVALKASSLEALQESIQDVLKAPVADTGHKADPGGDIGLILGNDGAAYQQLAAILYHTQPVFRRHLDICAQLADEQLAIPLRELACASPAAGYAEVPIVQFTVAYALASMWQSWGLTPRQIAGQGAAECAVACIAGVFSLADAVRLMVAHSAVVHAGLFKAAIPDVAATVTAIQFRAAEMDVYQNDSSKTMATPVYWAGWSPDMEAIPVDIQCMKNAGVSLLLGAGLTPAAIAGPTDGMLFLLLDGSGDIWDQLTDIVSALYRRGWEVDWQAFDNGYGYRKISLPAYPFQRSEFRIEKSIPAPVRELQQDPVNQLSPQQVVSVLTGIMADLLRESPADISTASPFVEMGVDSIMLMEAAKKIEQTFSVVIPVKMFFNELKDIDALSVYIAAQSERLVPAPPETDNRPVYTESEGAATSLDSLAGQVLALNRQLISLLNKGSVLQDKVVAPHPAIQAKPAHELVDPFTAFKNKKQSGNNGAEKKHGLTPLQEKHLQELTARLNQRTAASKRYAAEGRRVLADNRASAGFRPSVKEMLYPIVGQSSKGSKFRDLDGNEYLDVSMGFGVNLFGHQPDFIEEAITRQLRLGMQLGPQSALAAEVAEGIVALTGVERVSFCNSGTEAVMTALRLARTRTGRTKIAIFAGAYHGHFDGVLSTAVSLNVDPSGVPVAPGITSNMSRDIIVLDYDHPQSLQLLEQYASELAGILVEPVQSRRPHLQPRDFLHALKAFTVKENIPLIFDEMITGFRIHPGGAQAYFGVKADIVTYGKIIGGGMPIGVVAGRACYMDGIDGGAWQYGDASFPETETTFFAGTFCKHPLTMAAALAVIKEIKHRGPALQESLNQKTSYLAGELNHYFRQHHLPLEVVYFGSLFRFASRSNIDLLFYHLLDKGVYIWEGRNLFLSDAHTQEDIALLILKVKESIEEMVAAGFLRSAIQEEDTLKLPLTRAQRQLWILSRLNETGSIAYNIPSNLELSGTLNVMKLNDAIRALTRRHETLRTRFSEDGMQMFVSREVDASFQLIDFSASGEKETQHLLNEWNRKESRTPFDMNGGLLYRFFLIRMAAGRHVLSLTVHHALLDGWSVVMLLKEAGELYAALCKGEAPRLGAPMQFREFVDLIENGDPLQKEKSKTYWLNHFADTVPVLELPVDFPRQTINTFNGKRLSESIDITVMDALKKTGQRYGCTLFVTILSAYTLLLRKLSGLPDFVIGIPSAGRFLKGSETVAGYCSHLLPIRTHFGADLTFPEHLRHTRTTLLEGFEHEHFYFAQLVEELSERENMMNNPLARATFNMDPTEEFAPLPGLNVKYLPTPLSYVAYDICLNIIKVDDWYEMAWEYNTDLFEETTIKRFSSCFRHILDQIVASADQPAAAFSLLSSAEKAVLLQRPLSNRVALPEEKCIHTLFEKSAAAHAGATAIVYREQLVTYQKLNERANQWAHFLKEKDTGNNNPLVILLEKSVEMAALMIGCWKAGICFAAVDPAAPKFRLELICKDACPDRVITRHALADALTDIAAGIIQLEEVADEVSMCPTVPVEREVRPDDVAYIAYTSGTTGVPKGIMATHEGVVNYLCYIRNTFGLSHHDVVLQLAPAGFDASIRDIFGPLMTGATVVMGTDSREPLRILDAISRHRVTCLLSTVPFMLAAVADMSREVGAADAFIRLVMVSGETLKPAVAKKIFRWLGEKVQLVNQYGPTECTMTSTFYIVQPEDVSKPAISVGKPIPNMEVYIVRDGHLVPDGVMGEIWIGGAGVAKGYFRQPELTSTRFVPDTFSGNTARMFYKTGDNGRLLPDGNIAFYGRTDNQVKIRGFRVELDEIADIIREYPGIRDCVTIHTTQNGEDCIQAFLVPESKEEVALKALVAYLTGRLPTYAVPSGFLLADTLPVTTNGKIDRKRLAAIAREITLAEDNTAPRNETEEKLVQIWKELLGKENISIHEDFFRAGGTSLKAIQLIGRVHRAFNKLLNAADIFKYPTISQQATLLQQLSGNLYEDIMPLPVQDTYELSHAQRRLWVLDQYEQQQVAYNISGMVTYAEELDVPVLGRAFEAVIDRHESLRTCFINEGGNPVQRIIPAGGYHFNIDYTDISLMDAGQQAAVVEDAKKQRAFALEQGPLLRVGVLKMAADRYVILCSTHHIVSDGWSMNILLNEVLLFYTAFRKGIVPELLPLTIQYKDFAAWQNRLFRDGNRDKFRSFWTNYFNGPLPLLELPYDKQRSPVHRFRGDVVSFEIDAALTEKIKACCDSQNVTLFMVLIAWVKVLLYRYSGQKEIITGVPLSGRTNTALEGQIGFYIGTVALRSVLDTTGTFAQLVAAVKENFLKIMPYTVYPFDMIVEDLDLKHVPGRSSLFDVMVQIQDTHQVISAGAEAGFLRETVVGTNTNSSKFDLTFNFNVPGPHNNLSVEVEFNTDLFFRSTIERMASDFLYIGAAMMGHPDWSVAHPGLLPAQEQQSELQAFTEPSPEF